MKLEMAAIWIPIWPPRWFLAYPILKTSIDDHRKLGQYFPYPKNMCLDAKIMFITAPEANICKFEITEYHDSYMYVGSIVYYGGHLEFQDD